MAARAVSVSGSLTGSGGGCAACLSARALAGGHRYVAKNPLSVYAPVVPRRKGPPTNTITHGPITCTLFRAQLNRYLASCGLLTA